MQSRVEDILKAIVDGTDSSTLPPPQSRNEALLLQVLDGVNETNAEVEQKLDKNLGVENAGKLVGINPTGDVVPADTQGGLIAVTETQISGDDYSINIEGEELESGVASVNGKTGAVTLGSGDIGYGAAVTYASGTVGKAVQDASENVFDLQQTVDGLGGNNLPLDSTDVQSETIKAAVDDLKTSITSNYSSNLSSLLEYGTLSTTGAEAVPTDGICVRTKFIEVNAGDKITCLYSYNSQGRTISAFRRLCFYDSAQQFLSKYEPAIGGDYFDPYYYEFLETTVPTNAKYVRGTIRTGNLPFTLLIDTGNNQFNTQSIANKSFYGAKYKSAFNGCIPILHAGGYSEEYAENTINNMMYNVLNHPDDHRPKFSEVDAKPCADNVWVVSHEDTFEYEGTTYTIKNTASDIAIAAGLPLLEPFIQLAHQYGFELMIDTGANNTTQQLTPLVDLVKQYGMIPYCFIAAGNRDDLWRLTAIEPSLNLAFTLFRKLWAADINQRKNINKLITGNLMIYLEKDSAVTLSDTDYINSFRKMGMSFGVHGFRNADSAVLKDWAKICDYICVPQANAYDYILSYDYT